MPRTSVALFAGTNPSRLCTCNVKNTHPHTHTQGFEKRKKKGALRLSAERISFALRALNYLPPKAFCVPIFKEAKGKTQAIHLPFCTHSELLQTTQKLMSQRAMTHIKCRFSCFAARLIELPRACSLKSHLQNAALLPAGARKRKGAHLHTLK